MCVKKLRIEITQAMLPRLGLNYSYAVMQGGSTHKLRTTLRYTKQPKLAG